MSSVSVEELGEFSGFLGFFLGVVTRCEGAGVFGKGIEQVDGPLI